MKRIAIIGSGGSGKSTFARELGSRLKMDVYHLDALFWKPGWEPVSKADQRKRQKELVRQEQWIIDGNYNSTLDIRLNAADTIIFLDFNRVLCTYRVIKRVLQYRNGGRPDMATGQKERFNLNFIKWVWKYPETNRPVVVSKLERLSGDKEILIFTSPQKAKKYMETLSEKNRD